MSSNAGRMSDIITGMLTPLLCYKNRGQVVRCNVVGNAQGMSRLQPACLGLPPALAGGLQ